MSVSDKQQADRFAVPAECSKEQNIREVRAAERRRCLWPLSLMLMSLIAIILICAAATFAMTHYRQDADRRPPASDLLAQFIDSDNVTALFPNIRLLKAEYDVHALKHPGFTDQDSQTFSTSRQQCIHRLATLTSLLDSRHFAITNKADWSGLEIKYSAVLHDRDELLLRLKERDVTTRNQDEKIRLLTSEKRTFQDELTEFKRTNETLTKQVATLKTRFAETDKTVRPEPGYKENVAWSLVLFQSERGYDAQFFERTVNEFHAANAAEHNVKVFLCGEKGDKDAQMKLDNDSFNKDKEPEWIGSSLPGSVESPDAVVEEILSRFPEGKELHCLLLVSSRCPVPRSELWKKMTVHVCCLRFPQEQPPQAAWESFCAEHGNGAFGAVEWKRTTSVDKLKTWGGVRSWLESRLQNRMMRGKR